MKNGFALKEVSFSDIKNIDNNINEFDLVSSNIENQTEPMPKSINFKKNKILVGNRFGGKTEITDTNCSIFKDNEYIGNYTIRYAFTSDMPTMEFLVYNEMIKEFTEPGVYVYQEFKNNRANYHGYLFDGKCVKDLGIFESVNFNTIDNIRNIKFKSKQSEIDK